MATPEAVSSGHTLGALIADIRRGSRGVGLVLVAIGTAMAGGCVWLALEEPPVLAGLAIPVLIAGVGAWGLRHRVRLHVGGIQVDHLIGRSSLRFDEADTLVYRAVAKNINGIPVGSYVWARLVSGRRKVTFNLRSGSEQAEALDDFRARAADAIAARAWERLRAGESFRWGLAVVLAPDVLRYRPSGMLGRKAEETVGYGDGLRYAFEAGSFSVYAADAERALFTMKCDEPNFYPGLVLFQHLTTPP